MNSYSFTGNLGADPEVKTVGEDQIIASFSVANTVRRKKGGEWTDHVNWLRVSCFGGQAKAVANNLKKGARVGVTGEVQVDQYTDKDGNKRTSFEVRAHSVDFLGGGQKEDSYNGPTGEIDEF